jgi:Kelch motif protein
MRRLLLLALAAPLAAGCGGAARQTHTPASSSPPPPPPRRRPVASRPRGPRLPLGLPAVPSGPVPGYVLIADRNNDRILLVSPTKRIVWRFPRPGDVRPGQSFHDPDDAFFTPDHRRVVTNEEFNDAIAQIDLRTHRIVWSYGRAGLAGSGPDELSNPDDAYVLRNGDVTVADIKNCRVLTLAASRRIVRSFGSPGSCAHDPPRTLSSPNGATPLPDGGVLITEIGGWVDRLDARGRLVWTVRTPTTYPSDAQLLPGGNILVAGFDTPGRVDVLTPRGRIVWTYGPPSGPGSLDRPSLAVRWPNGMIAVTDDWNHRVVVIDPRTKRIVWQYGHKGIASSAPGYLSKPDGLDLLRAPQVSPPQLSVTRIGALPRAAARIAAASDGGAIVAAGGETPAGSLDWVLRGAPARLRTVGRLPAPTHDAALAELGSFAYLFGGGQAASIDSVVRVSRSGVARPFGRLGEPLSDLGAAVVGGRVYLVGGYTGSRYASAVLRYRPGRAPAVVARLPSGLRYAGVAALGRTIYVAGGLTTAGPTDAVLAVDPARGSVRRIGTLPVPVAHAPLAALRGRLYLIGGQDSSGRTRAGILSIDPRSGGVTTAGRLPRPLADAAAVGLPGRIVVLGGTANGSPTDAVLALR